MQKVKSLRSAFLKTPTWVWLLLGISIVSWTYANNARENRTREQQARSVASINADADELKAALNDTGKKVAALKNRKPWTKADEIELRAVEAQLQALHLRIDDINRRLSVAHGAQNKR